MNGSRIDLVLIFKFDGLEIDDQVGEFFGDLIGFFLVFVVFEVFFLGLKVKVKLLVKVWVVFWFIFFIIKVVIVKFKLGIVNIKKMFFIMIFLRILLKFYSCCIFVG